MRNRYKNNVDLQRGAAHLFLVFVFVLVLIGALGFVGYNSWQRQQADAAGTASVGSLQAKIKNLTAAISKEKKAVNESIAALEVKRDLTQSVWGYLDQNPDTVTLPTDPTQLGYLNEAKKIRAAQRVFWSKLATEKAKKPALAAADEKRAAAYTVLAESRETRNNARDTLEAIIEKEKQDGSDRSKDYEVAKKRLHEARERVNKLREAHEKVREPFLVFVAGWPEYQALQGARAFLETAADERAAIREAITDGKDKIRTLTKQLKEAQRDLEEVKEGVGKNAAFDTTVMSYNVRTGHLNNRMFGDPDNSFDADDDRRMKGIAEVISGHNAEIVALQEVRTPERASLASHLPSKYRLTTLTGNGETVIAWNNDLYTLVKTDNLSVPVYTGVERPEQWVKLQHNETGQNVYLIDLHLATESDALRERASTLVVNKMQSLVGTSKDVFFVAGDMNSNDRQPGRNAAYKTFKASGILKYAREAAADVKGDNCDTANSRAGSGGQDCRSSRGSHIDHIWVSKQPNVEVHRYTVLATRTTSMLSDHNPVIVRVTVPKHQ